MIIFNLCVKIFFARICDVSLGTIRQVVTVKGKSVMASVIAFAEVFIWFIVAREAINTEITSLWIPIAYSSGYASGTFIGSLIANNFIKGLVGVQVISSKISKEMIKSIRDEGFAVSIIKLDSTEEDEKNMLFIQINNFKLKKLIKLIKSLDNKAFIVVNETKYIQNGFIK